MKQLTLETVFMNHLLVNMPRVVRIKMLEKLEAQSPQFNVNFKQVKKAFESTLGSIETEPEVMESTACYQSQASTTPQCFIHTDENHFPEQCPIKGASSA